MSGAMNGKYTYGLQCISENQLVSGSWTASFCGYDGAGSVRLLTNASGAVTDTYEYDAWGVRNGDGLADFVVSSLTVLLSSTQNASATISTPLAPASGMHNIVASYAGDANHFASGSASLTVVSPTASPIVVITSSANPAAYGNSLTLSVRTMWREL